MAPMADDGIASLHDPHMLAKKYPEGKRHVHYLMQPVANWIAGVADRWGGHGDPGVFPQESLSETARLNTGPPGVVLTRSAMK